MGLRFVSAISSFCSFFRKHFINRFCLQPRLPKKYCHSRLPGLFSPVFNLFNRAFLGGRFHINIILFFDVAVKSSFRWFTIKPEDPTQHSQNYQGCVLVLASTAQASLSRPKSRSPLEPPPRAPPKPEFEPAFASTTKVLEPPAALLTLLSSAASVMPFVGKEYAVETYKRHHC
jgi:hypothetical protein